MLSDLPSAQLTSCRTEPSSGNFQDDTVQLLSKAERMIKGSMEKHTRLGETSKIKGWALFLKIYHQKRF